MVSAKIAIFNTQSYTLLHKMNGKSTGNDRCKNESKIVRYSAV